MIQAAVITVSDSVHAGTRSDRSGPAVRDRLEQLGWRVSVMEVVPDEREQIAARLSALADAGRLSAIFTTGGTGIAVRDVTPEATRDVVEREIPGLGELMRLQGRKATPLSALSRAVSGVRGSVLIVNLPGSQKGAVESLDAVIDLVPHILELLNGHTEHAGQQEPAARL